MDIQSISIVPANQSCSAKCKYCIAHMTKTPRSERRNLELSKLTNSLLYAKSGGCQTAILTSKGETLSIPSCRYKDNNITNFWVVLREILYYCKRTGEIGQRDLHTNGKLILDNYDEFQRLLVDDNGITNVTLTVASLNMEINKKIMGIDINYKDLFKFLKSMGLHIRLSCVLNKEGVGGLNIKEYIDKALKFNIDAIVFRELWIPEGKENKIKKWSVKNFVNVQYVRNFLSGHKYIYPILELPWGEIVYDYKGMQLTTATCEVNKYKTGFKSVVHLPDGHLYAGWDSKASKIM